MRRARQAALAASLAASLALTLAACGKQADLRGPDGREGEFTFPRPYPNPATVVPAAGPAQGPTQGPAQEPAARPQSREVLEGAGDISVFPNTRRTRTTYGSPAPR